ncbi:hypothetical protein NEOLEDRAFT_162517 [Neolentinus lepideus HHB14362 ss-1]|uniref:Uncharacterized protein n=1 Tax=Neolentinus lepideus HHB14362 ss-1 TaxID=1314782 RepID=A0A165TUG5_9AGAM|nr:hypothetical protein NEOLEDRAFT_162517 [Neolentinus lepideus HHB14362 ss-1]
MHQSSCDALQPVSYLRPEFLLSSVDFSLESYVVSCLSHLLYRCVAKHMTSRSSAVIPGLGDPVTPLCDSDLTLAGESATVRVVPSTMSGVHVGPMRPPLEQKGFHGIGSSRAE